MVLGFPITGYSKTGTSMAYPFTSSPGIFSAGFTPSASR